MNNVTKNEGGKTGIVSPDFKEFCRGNKLDIWLIAIFLLFGYGMKLFNITISHDTEAIMVSSDSLYNAWYQMGRYGEILIKKVMGTYWFNPYVASFLMIVTLVFSAVVWMYLFYAMAGEKLRKSLKLWIFPVIFWVSPIMGEQLSFLLQSFEVTLVMTFVGLALICIYKAIIEKKYFYYVAYLVLTVLSFATYQAMVPLYIAGATACFLLLYDRYTFESDRYVLEKGFLWKIIGKLIAMFFVSYLTYSASVKVVLRVLNKDRTPYIDDQMLWGTVPIKTCLINIKEHVLKIMRGDSIFYTITFSVLCIITIGYLLYQIKNKYEGYYLYSLAMLFFLACPFLMTLVLGQGPAYRVEINLPFVVAFLLMYMVSKVFLIKEPISKWVRLAALIVALIIAINQSQTVARLYYTEYVKYQEDVGVATKISDRIEQLNLGESPMEPVVFVGTRTPRLNPSCFKVDELELLGKSFFSVSFSTKHGTFIMRNFMNTLGYVYNFPSEEQCIQAEKDAADMECWPNTGSVKAVNGVVIVKLS